MFQHRICLLSNCGADKNSVHLMGTCRSQLTQHNALPLHQIVGYLYMNYHLEMKVHGTAVGKQLGVIGQTPSGNLN